MSKSLPIGRYIITINNTNNTNNLSVEYHESLKDIYVLLYRNKTIVENYYNGNNLDNLMTTILHKPLVGLGALEESLDIKETSNRTSKEMSKLYNGIASLINRYHTGNWTPVGPTKNRIATEIVYILLKLNFNKILNLINIMVNIDEAIRK
jgi:hypothetical protein